MAQNWNLMHSRSLTNNLHCLGAICLQVRYFHAKVFHSSSVRSYTQNQLDLTSANHLQDLNDWFLTICITKESLNFLHFCWYFKYWSCFVRLCAIAESFRFGWPVVLCLLSLVQFFLSFPWKYFCAGWLIQEVWVHWGSAIIYCFLHLKAGTFNTSNFCPVSYFWDCWDFLTGHGVLFCQSAARNISFLHLKLLWSPPSILILLASLLLQVVKKPTLLDSSRGCQK